MNNLFNTIEIIQVNGRILFPKEYTDKIDSIEVGATRFTSEMAREAAVQDSITNGVTNMAPSQNAVFNAFSTKLDSSSYTAGDVLAKLKTVDGAGSGIDADLLDGQDGSYYQNASNINAGTLQDARIPALAIAKITGLQAALDSKTASATVTASRTLALTDAGKMLNADHATTAIVLTVPPTSSVAILKDTEIQVRQAGAAAVTISAGAGVSIQKPATRTNTLAEQYSVVTLKKGDGDVWALFGDLGIAP